MSKVTGTKRSDWMLVNFERVKVNLRRTTAEVNTLKKIGGALAGMTLIFTLACGGHSSTPATTSVVPPPPVSNVQAITVNAGPSGNTANGAFTSVTVCTPGRSTCQTIDGILVDTGSSGLRILSSALTGVTLRNRPLPTATQLSNASRS